ncbi:MAG: hypothetical protein OJF52_003483 [Nitrospira sp.]|jgi:hypothetical protein|nr:MAG: hypothetical protein OJF52_003483 [Nitrospira sp.]
MLSKLKNAESSMSFGAVVLLLLTLYGPVTPAHAGNKGKFLGLIAQYEDIKANILEELAHADELRKDGYSSDAKRILALSKESMDLQLETDRFQLEASKALRVDPQEQPIDLHAVYALSVALHALQGAISTEFQYQLGEHTPFNLHTRAQYEQMAQSADTELKNLQTNAGSK